jgi:hypothetical protein
MNVRVWYPLTGCGTVVHAYIESIRAVLFGEQLADDCRLGITSA